jgi:hypothetical protein
MTAILFLLLAAIILSLACRKWFSHIEKEKRLRIELNWWAVPVRAGMFLTVWGPYYGVKPEQTWFCGGREWGPSGPFDTESAARAESRRIGKIVNGPTVKKLTG